MKRILFISLLMITIIPCVSAQKKEIAQARSFIKNGKNLDKAEELMRNLLKDSLLRDNEKVYLTLFEAVMKQRDQGNELLYLQQKTDTADFFEASLKAHLAYLALDSVEVLHNKKDHSQLKYRQRFARHVGGVCLNLYKGGEHFKRKGNTRRAIDFYDEYIASYIRNAIALQLRNDSKSDSMVSQAAFNALHCAYKLDDVNLMEKYAPLARKNQSMLPYQLQYMANIYRKKGEEKKYVGSLEEGFEKFPQNLYFFSHLVGWYGRKGKYDKALEVVSRALEVDSTNRDYHLAKSSVFLNQKKYGECLAICDSLLQLNDSLPEAILNTGLAYYNMAVEKDKQPKQTVTVRKKIHNYYEKAMVYLEKYRSLYPERKRRWLHPLYIIYLNLNQGEKFDEINALMNEEN